MKINLLDDKTINKIAAGEVVQNPASVVKELLENSIDSGASAITVDIEGGGIVKIRISDNGCGISNEDIQTAFLRHATSKLRSAAELYSIETLGFRGEALASIGAVSNLSVVSKTDEEEMGSGLAVDGGKMGGVKRLGIPTGTTITVSNLFFNTPPRLKFLKNAGVEGGYITEIVAKYILAYPEISFNYINNAKTIFHSDGSGSLERALVAVYGAQMLSKIRFVSNNLSNVALSGYVGLPQFALKNRRHQSFFVNRRYVSDGELSKSLQHAYGDRLLKGNFPFAVLFLEVPPADIDVNIHPQKLMVKFRDLSAVDFLISQTVDDCLRQNPIQGEIKQREVAPVQQKPLPTMENISIPEGFAVGFAPKVLKLEQREEHLAPTPHRVDEPVLERKQNIVEPPVVEKHADEPVQLEMAKKPLEDYIILGTLFDSYLLLQQGEELLFVDQHAAHERLLYDDMLRKIAASEPISQMLLFPETIQLTPDEIELFLAYSDEISKIGFVTKRTDEHLEVQGIPAIGQGLSPVKLLDELFFELSQLNRSTFLYEKVIGAMCKKAIKANTPLSKGEVALLMEMYAQSEEPTCPHGRPIVSRIHRKQIEKGFMRL